MPEMRGRVEEGGGDTSRTTRGVEKHLLLHGVRVQVVGLKMKKEKGDVFEKVRKMRTLVDCVNYLFGGKWEGMINKYCDYNHHLFELRREKDMGLFKEKGFVLDICDDDGRRIFSAVDTGGGFGVRYFMKIKKPRMMNALFRMLSMPYHYRDKEGVLEDLEHRIVYNEGRLEYSMNQDRTFDSVVERFCDDIFYAGGRIPSKLKKEIMKLKSKLIVKIPVFNGENGKFMNYIRVKRDTGKVLRVNGCEVVEGGVEIIE